MTNRPSDACWALWTTLLRAHQAALGSVERALKEAGLPPLEWYDVLLELERAGEKGLRLFELEKRLLLPQYGTSRLVKRLEQAGLVARRASRADRRGFVVSITATGRRMRRRMWPVYADAVQRAVGERVGEDEAREAAALLLRLAAESEEDRD